MGDASRGRARSFGSVAGNERQVSPIGISNISPARFLVDTRGRPSPPLLVHVAATPPPPPPSSIPTTAADTHGAPCVRMHARGVAAGNGREDEITGVPPHLSQNCNPTAPGRASHDVVVARRPGDFRRELRVRWRHRHHRATTMRTNAGCTEPYRPAAHTPYGHCAAKITNYGSGGNGILRPCRAAPPAGVALSGAARGHSVTRRRAIRRECVGELLRISRVRGASVRDRAKAENGRK